MVKFRIKFKMAEDGFPTWVIESKKHWWGRWIPEISCYNEKEANEMLEQVKENSNG